MPVTLMMTEAYASRVRDALRGASETDPILQNVYNSLQQQLEAYDKVYTTPTETVSERK